MLLSALRQVAGNPSMLRLEAGWLTALTADGAYLVSLLVYAYHVGGVAAVGLVAMLRSLPAGLLAPVLTALADRFPRARVLLAIHLARAVAVGIVALAALADMPTGIALVAVVAEGLMVGLHRATTLAFMPGLARSPEELLAGNAAVSLGEAIGGLIGPIVAGILLAAGGPALGLVVPAVLYLAAAMIVLSIHARGAGRVPAPPAGAEPSSRIGAVLGGFAALRRHPSAGVIGALFGGQTFVRGALNVLLVATAVELLGLGESGVGYLASAVGAGGLLGAGLAMTIAVGRRLATPFAASLALWGLPIALLGLFPNPIVAFVLAGIVGAANASLDVSGFTLLQRSVPNAVRGRVFGAIEGIAAIGMAAGAAVTPALIEIVGLQPALVVVGLILPLLAIAGYPLVRRADEAAVVPERELAILRQVPIFAPLPLTLVEHLAGSLEPVRFAAGAEIISQGDAGNCFYVIADGSVDVVHDDRLVKTLGPGDGFGEIALLSARPRTASVVVREPMEGYRLYRAAFLEAVTGSPQSEAAADRLMSQRLAELGH